jgi:single-stranded DNA-binding protein
MADINYAISMVKILEEPVCKVLKGNILVTKFRAQFPQIRNSRIINIIFWGNLANDISNYYKVNDYILVEGYLSSINHPKNKLMQTPQKLYLTVIKLYSVKTSLEK